MAAVVCVGIATLDEIVRVDSVPEQGRKVRASSRTVIGGGVAANASVTVARLGGQASFAGPVGDDHPGETIRSGLADEGVELRHVPAVAGQGSPVSVVMVDDDGERTIVNHAGAELFTTAPLPEREHFANADAVMTDVRWPAGAVVALSTAADRGIPGVVDCDHDPTAITEVLAAASHVIFSLPVLERFTGIEGPEALRAISGVTDAWVAGTDGANGVYWVDDDALRHLPATPVDAVDTLGAGDTFSGAFTLALAEGGNPADAIGFASRAAALKCTRPGGRAGIPTREDVMALGDRR